MHFSCLHAFIQWRKARAGWIFHPSMSLGSFGSYKQAAPCMQARKMHTHSFYLGIDDFGVHLTAFELICVHQTHSNLGRRLFTCDDYEKFIEMCRKGVNNSSPIRGPSINAQALVSHDLDPWSSCYWMRLMVWRLWVWITAPYIGWTFFLICICGKNCNVFLKRRKINGNESGDGQFLKNSCITWTTWSCKPPCSRSTTCIYID